MAPRKASRGTGKSTPKKRVAASGFKLPDPIPAGQVITDMAKNDWVLGKSIGQGGFGEIYLASNDPSRAVRDTDKYVVKVEPHTNGPLFTEMHCYMRIAKPDLIDTWMKEHKLKRFGMPKYLGSGSFEYKNQKYRFMVMERFGSDLQKILEKHNHKFSFKTVYQVGIEIIDVLEYIHDKGYIHADIKASNLLVGYQKGTENQVFLVDYGLACRYAIDGVHKEYKYDGRKAHDGTIEFTSRDAHIGAHSRRGDLEILSYNLAQWLCARLPWEDNLPDCDYVAKSKRWYMDNVDKFIDKCFPDVIPAGLQEFMTYVASLTFDEKPDYEKCRNILRRGLVTRGYKDDGKLVFMSATPKPVKKSKSRINKVSPPKKQKTDDDDDMSEGNERGLNESADMFDDSENEEVIEEVVTTTVRKRIIKGARNGTPKRGSSSSSTTTTTLTPRSSTGSTPRTGKNSGVKRSRNGVGVKKMKVDVTDDSDDDDDHEEEEDIECIESPESDEKENSSRRANTRVKPAATKLTKPKKIVQLDFDVYDDVVETSKPVAKITRAKRTVEKVLSSGDDAMEESNAPINLLVKKSKPAAKGRSTAAAVKRSGSKDSLASSIDDGLSCAGFDNPTPAMIEMIERRNAKLALKKRK